MNDKEELERLEGALLAIGAGQLALMCLIAGDDQERLERIRKHLLVFANDIAGYGKAGMYCEEGLNNMANYIREQQKQLAGNNPSQST